MSIRVNLSAPEGFDLAPDKLRAAAEACLRMAQRSAGELSIKLTDDKTMRQAHRQYVGSDKTTDVLSFPHGEIDPDSGLPYFGDILISVPQARKQAAEMGHGLQAELALLIVHGTLHLLGYDHADPAGQAKMWQLQQEVLKSLGIKAEVPNPDGP